MSSISTSIVLDCASDELRQAIRRNQLPLIPTHSTFARLQYPEEIETMFEEHLTVFDLVLAGRKRQAMAALEAHIRRSLDPNLARLKRLGKLPNDLRRAFLVPIAPGSK